ncbi:hypothetical protein AKJ51_02480 [candidate division MSBL1 archaeon SCGC-AAA382A20]|uniref:Radical SAM core domain-containing protein n=1 Tax=candidate division MSBL1 archaeon SCGC-AAA382A20 TaxID=1698280 RepID=A0A133VKH6_9EURY|nr:hypothetical protein AKJ51_02480 [candidate division MSBL1 archaeon SCGC-AAA382A20]
MVKFLSDLENCTLCEWRCGVDRLNRELGVCRVGKPKVASAMLHPAPPESYTIFLAGCNFKCLNCQNWSIAHFPDSEKQIRGFIEPKVLGKEAYEAVNSPKGISMGADRIFFSGGSPTPSLPYIEEVVKEARKIGEIKVNYDTNGFLTLDSLKRVIGFTNSITFDIKAYHDIVHRALTGAPVGPVLRNAKYVAEKAQEKLWEFRVLLIPGISEGEIKPLAEFFSEIDSSLPLNFLAFRPNFVMSDYMGASQELMKRAVNIARETGLEKASFSGLTDIPGKIPEVKLDDYAERAEFAEDIARKMGCVTHPRNCGECPLKNSCPIKNYNPDKNENI